VAPYDHVRLTEAFDLIEELLVDGLLENVPGLG
jgi:hypothetical protein